MPEIQSIESLKKTLLSLEKEIEITRSRLQALQQEADKLSCAVEIFWNREKNSYTTLFIKNYEVIYSTDTKKSSRSLATLGIARADGLNPRVPWKYVDAGNTWKTQAVIHSWYWEKYLNPCELLKQNVISISTYFKSNKR